MHKQMMMKGIAKVFIVTAFLISLASCERKSCKDVLCPLGQNCSQGACYCPDGYEGSDCSTVSADKFASSYYVSVNCYGSSPPFGIGSYNSNIQLDTDPRLVHISFFGGMCDVIGYVRTDRSNQGNIIEINPQNCGATTISGQGTWNATNRQIVFDLNITYNGTYQCQHIFFKN